MGQEFIESGDLAEIVGRSHFHHIVKIEKGKETGTSLTVSWLGLHVLTAKGLGSISSKVKIPYISHITRPKKDKNKSE